MSDVFSFVSGDGKMEFTVKTAFKEKCPDPEKHKIYELMTTFKLNQYLHNPAGPAMVRLKDNRQEYWIDGQILTQEQGAKLCHNFNFKNKLQDTINE
jgi:hypothetical protein